MRVLIIDSYPLFREALALQVAKVAEQASVFEAGSLEEAMAITDMTPSFDLLIWSFTEIEHQYVWLKELKDKSAKLKVLLFFDKHQLAVELKRKIEVDGILAKSADLREVQNALKLILAGETYVSPSLLITQKNQVVALDRNHKKLTCSPLTPRQLQVLRLIAVGLSNKDIANELQCSDGTIKLHVSAILKEFKVSNRVGALKYAAKLGLLVNY